MSEPIYNENDTPLDKLRYKKYIKDQLEKNGETCEERTEPTTVSVSLVRLDDRWFCLPKSFPDLEGPIAIKDTMCKTYTDWIDQIPGLTPVGQLYWTGYFKQLTGYNSQQECEQNCQKRWYCNNDDEECELLDAQNEDGSFRSGVGYVSKDECEQECPTESPS